MPAVWHAATVVAVRDETSRTKTLRLRLDAPSGHLAGQHYVVRLTAPDGYTASRSYSVASPPDGGTEVDLTVDTDYRRRLPRLHAWNSGANQPVHQSPW